MGDRSASPDVFSILSLNLNQNLAVLDFNRIGWEWFAGGALLRLPTGGKTCAMTWTDKLFPRRIPFDHTAFMGAGRIDRDDRLGFLDIPGDGDRFLVWTQGFYGAIWAKVGKIRNGRVPIGSSVG